MSTSAQKNRQCLPADESICQAQNKIINLRPILVGQDPKAILPISAELLKSSALINNNLLIYKKLICLTLFLFLTMLVSCSKSTDTTNTNDIEQVKYYTYEIVNTYPHDSGAFTQGLIYYDNNLYEGTGLRGESTLRFVDLETGTVLRQREIAQATSGNYFGEGITIFRDTVYQLTYTSQVGFKYNKDTFDSLSEFSYSTYGWGLTHDGTNLIMSDGSHRLSYINPDNFDVIKIIEVTDTTGPVVRLNELEYINGEIYANIWMSNRIAVISPITGEVTAWIDLTGIAIITPSMDFLNGIAYDEATDRLLVTGKLWPNLFEIKLIEVD